MEYKEKKYAVVLFMNVAALMSISIAKKQQLYTYTQKKLCNLIA